MSNKNPVAKNMGKFNRPTIHLDRKKVAKAKAAKRAAMEAKKSWLADLI